MKINKIDGLIAAPFTPMHADGSINTRIISAYARKLKNDGLAGVFICGTTGEGMFLTTDERRQVAEAWIKEQTSDFKVIVHVGSTSVKQARELAEHAQMMGAYAVGAMGPVFLKPTTTQKLVEFCAEVASGCPELPFYYYHIPPISGINLPMVDFLNEAEKIIPNLAGIKFTDNNFMEMQKCLQLNHSKWDILHGFDEVLLAGLSFGVKGAVGSTYNYAAGLYLELIRAFNAGETEKARGLQLQSVALVDVLLKYEGALVAGKKVMKFQGLDCGPCRLPLPNLSDEQENALKAELDKLNYKLF